MPKADPSHGSPPAAIRTSTTSGPGVRTASRGNLLQATPDGPAVIVGRPVRKRPTRRPRREVAFRRRLREAYEYRCGFSGLRRRKGGGRPEVEATPVRPVDRQGSDSVPNGLAPSGMLRGMFDRGLVWRNQVPPEVADRLIQPGGKRRPPPTRSVIAIQPTFGGTATTSSAKALQ